MATASLVRLEMIRSGSFFFLAKAICAPGRNKMEASKKAQTLARLLIHPSCHIQDRCAHWSRRQAYTLAYEHAACQCFGLRLDSRLRPTWSVADDAFTREFAGH